MERNARGERTSIHGWRIRLQPHARGPDLAYRGDRGPAALEAHRAAVSRGHGTVSAGASPLAATQTVGDLGAPRHGCQHHITGRTGPRGTGSPRALAEPG